MLFFTFPCRLQMTIKDGAAAALSYDFGFWIQMDVLTCETTLAVSYPSFSLQTHIWSAGITPWIVPQAPHWLTNCHAGGSQDLAPFVDHTG